MREASPRLGRGLATLLGDSGDASREKERQEPAGILQTIPLESIRTSPYQPRRDFDPASLADLARSIAQQGVLQPILVRRLAGEPARYELVAGERRLRAAAQAGLAELPCLVRPLADSASALAALVENLQRDDLNVLDEAEGFRHAIERFALTQDALAEAIGRSRSHVANTLRLLQLPEPVRDHLRAGRLTAGHARALLTRLDPAADAERVIARGLTVRQTEELPPLAPQPRITRTRSASADPNLSRLEQDLTEKLGLAVSISDRGGNGRLTLSYSTLDQLDALVTLLTRP